MPNVTIIHRSMSFLALFIKPVCTGGLISMNSNVLCTLIMSLWNICIIRSTSILTEFAGFPECLFKLQLRIVYCPGQHNTAANVLSCISHSVGVGDSTSIVHHSLQYLDNPIVAA